MNTAVHSFVVLSAAALVLISIFAAAVAVAGSVLYRSTLLRTEVATRRALGARRSHIVRMLLGENALGIAAGLGVASLVLLAAGWIILIGSAALLTAAGVIGGWVAGRYAVKMPVSRSGRFRTTPDI